MKYRDRVKRVVKERYGEKRFIYVPRYKCTSCGYLHRVLPEDLLPFKHYSKDVIDGAVEGLITNDILGFEDYPSDMQIKRWKKENAKITASLMKRDD